MARRLARERAGAPVLRVAKPADAPALEALMKQSAAVLFPRFYDEAAAASAVRHVAQIDPRLLADGTYYVLEVDGDPVACGGWSRRDRLYTGSGAASGDERELDPATEAARVRAMFVRADWTRRGLGRRILEECEAAAGRAGFRTLSLLATLPGVPLYLAYGFLRSEEVEVLLPDGLALPCVAMTKELTGTPGRDP